MGTSQWLHQNICDWTSVLPPQVGQVLVLHTVLVHGRVSPVFSSKLRQIYVIIVLPKLFVFLRYPFFFLVKILVFKEFYCVLLYSFCKRISIFLFFVLRISVRSDFWRKYKNKVGKRGQLSLTSSFHASAHPCGAILFNRKSKGISY